MTKKKESIEEMLNKLELIARELESGELNLDQSLKKFEMSVKTFKECKKIISQAEEKIKILTESLEEVDF
jgi:exodeoxyribonuclease VII small subunit